MNVNCSTCLELLSASDDLSCTPCGHVFHSPCILQWFETGKSSCPQCRNKCREGQLRRLFLSEGAGADARDDPARLQGKLDSLAFQVRCLEKEKKEAREKADGLSAANVALKEEFKQSERQKQAIKDSLTEAKAQINYMRGEKSQAKQAKEEAAELRQKLLLYEAIDDIVRGSAGDVNNRLHDLGDFSQASRQLSIIIVALKKELSATDAENKSLRAESRSFSSKLSQLRSKVEDQAREILHFRDANRGLQADLRQSEEDISGLREEMCRLKREVDTKDTEVLLDEKENEEDESNLTKSSGPAGPAKKRRAAAAGSQDPDCHLLSQFNIMKKGRLGQSQPSSSVKSTPSSTQFYNGLGGHSKADNFPIPLKKDFKLKRLPKSTSKPASSAKINNTINKYFNFETP